MNRCARFVLLFPLMLLGCAHGFDRAALQERLNDGSLQINDASIAEVRSLKAQLKFPCRIAVYFQSEHRDRTWTTEDMASMDKWGEALKAEGIAAEIFPLPEMLAGKGEVKELRLAAAKCGADVLFIIRGAAQTDSYKNFAAVLNLTIVGGFVVPASHRDSLFMMEGVLMDVDNGYIYAAVQAEGVGKSVGPTFIIEDKLSIERARSSAMIQFGTAVLERMRSLAAKQTASR